MSKKLVLFSVILIFLGFSFTSSYGEHIFKNNEAFAQFLDISQLSSQKYTLEYDKEIFDIYYGFEGTVESSAGENKPEIESMTINLENKSIDITFKKVPEDELFWIRLPTKLIEAQNEKYNIVVDDSKIEYDLTKYSEDYAIGMSIPKNTHKIVIQGTRIIPEFGSISIIVLVVAITTAIVLKSGRLGIK